MGCYLYNVSLCGCSMKLAVASSTESTDFSLGTTRAAAGSAAAFEKIDREYVHRKTCHVWLVACAKYTCTDMSLTLFARQRSMVKSRR